MSAEQFDAIVVGGSLAGCAAAVLLARQGARVALLERHARPDAHKALCTHFILPCALPVLQRLGLDRLIEQAGGVRNGAEIHTPFGWIGNHLASGPAGQPRHGYSIRRSRLDPMVRELACNTPGVSLMTGWPVRALVEQGGRITGVLAHQGEQERTLMAPLVVAADGRQSDMASLAGITAHTSPNQRHGLLLALRGVDLQRGSCAQMWLTGPEVAYVFPNEDGVAVLAWMAPKAALANLPRTQLMGALLARIRSLPDAPQLHAAVPLGEVLSVKDFPNQWRPPVVRGMALVGDAATSLDYLHGVGCGWAFESAGWLADAVGPALQAGQGLDAALGAYASQHRRKLAPHRFFINDFATRLRFNPVERLLYAAGARDAGMAQHMGRVGARMSSPWTLLSPACLARAAWVLWRQPSPGHNGTRLPLDEQAARARLVA